MHATFDSVLAALTDATAIGVDIPIGLVARGVREADLEVRRFLVRRPSSLFVMPPRGVVTARTYETACARAVTSTGKRISRQAFNLFEKLREVDRHVGDARLVEVHPETSFALMAGEPGLVHGKRSWAGVARRRALLAAEGIALPDAFGTAVDAVGVDDVLDAAAAAWSARRFARGEARTFGGGQRDRSGRSIAIVG